MYVCLVGSVASLGRPYHGLQRNSFRFRPVYQVQLDQRCGEIWLWGRRCVGDCRISGSNCCKRFNKTCVPRVLRGYMRRLGGACLAMLGSRNFGRRFSRLLHSCMKHPSPLCLTHHLSRGCKYGVCLGQRSLGRANTRGVGGAVNRVLLTHQVNGAHVVTRANTKRRKMTATAIYTLVGVRYVICVNGASIRHRRVGMRGVGVLNTAIVPMASKGVALGSTAGRTVHS